MMGLCSFVDNGEGYFSKRFLDLWREHLKDRPGVRIIEGTLHVTGSVNEAIRYDNEKRKFKRAYNKYFERDK